MNNELIQEKSWWKRNWKWLAPLIGIVLISMVVFFSSGLGTVATDITKAYTDMQLYENALQKVKSNKRVIEVLGEIEPIDKLAILEGEVHYTNENQTVNSSIRIKGKKKNARMDILAVRINDEWNYKKINIRIKTPPNEKQLIEVLAK